MSPLLNKWMNKLSLLPWLLLHMKIWQFHFTSWVTTLLFLLSFPKWCRQFLHCNLETNPVCPVLLVVARLWAKGKAIRSSLQQRAPTIIPLGNARAVEKSVSTLNNVDLDARLWLRNLFFTGWLPSAYFGVFFNQCQIFSPARNESALLAPIWCTRCTRL